jgi:hypothetical protein
MITFLSSDHTHVDVDQIFSNLVIYMLSNSVQYITDLIGALTKSNPTSETRPTGAFLSTGMTVLFFLLSLSSKRREDEIEELFEDC